MPAAKMAKTGQEGEGWTCRNCNNFNFETRAFCNMRKCGAAGPWNCPACGNKNFQGRDVCNRRNCSTPRPGNPAGVPAGMQAVMLGGMVPGTGAAPGGAVNHTAAIQAIKLLQTSGLASLPGMDKAVAQIVTSVGGGGPVTAKGGKDRVQEGSWVCLVCGNINFPNRDSCNAKACGRPRHEVDGGASRPGASSRSIFMPGSWACGACKNINWPRRESCGMRSCGRPRHEVDAGPPTPQAQMAESAESAESAAGPAPRPTQQFQAEQPGSWTCPHCGNLNYPNRTVCNRRSCGQPRGA